MTQKFVHLFLFLILTVLRKGQAFDFTTEPESCLCNCGQPMCDFVKFVRDLDKRLTVASEKIMDLIKLHNTFTSFQRANAAEHKEMMSSIKKLWAQLNSNKYPTSESLVLPPQALVSTSAPVMADEAVKMTKNFTTLIEDKFKEVNSLSSEVTELQHENKVLKEKIEEEKRVRRSLQDQVYFVEERLNQTHSWVLEINEKVNDKDSENSTVDEVAEIVFTKIAEFDVLNKSAIEYQLKKLEYTVKDAFKNETQLAQRLDSVENASAYTVGLLGNGTLVDKVQNIAITIQTLENVQSQQSDVLSQLEQQMNDVNGSLARKLEAVEFMVSMRDLYVNETFLYVESELSKMNDSWSEKSAVVDNTLATIDEKVSESTNITGRVVNTTKDMEVLFKSMYTEALTNITVIQEEMEKAQISLQELIQLPDELISVKSVLNRTVDKDELHGLWEHSKLVEEKAFVLYTNMSGIISNTEEKVDAMESKYSDENDLIKQQLGEFLAQELQAKERLDSLHLEFQNVISNQTVTFDVLQSRLGNLSSKVEETGQQNELALSTIVNNMSELRDLQHENEFKIRRSFEAMEKVLFKKIDVHKEEITDLKIHLETFINSTTRREETVSDGDESFLSRAKIDLGESSTEATTEALVPCRYIPLTNADEQVIAYFDEDVYKELFQETWISHGGHLFFSCKKIGRSVLIGAHTVACDNGQWNDQFPRCEKLLEESVIRDASEDKGDPCLAPRGQFPDPSDCGYYFNCWDDTKKREKCPNGLHFNAHSMKCDYLHSANCTVHQANRKVDHLGDIIPPVDFAPHRVDAVNSLLSAGITGELVVYPGVNLNLICLYPRKLGEPHWEIMEQVSHPHIPAWDTRGISNLEDAYKLKLSIPTVTQDYSGNYTCVTPNGRRYTIRLLVKDVRCPEFDVDVGSHVSVSYRPNPEGLQRVLTTQASFDCSPGYSVNGSNTAICKASGLWSHDLPTCQKEEIIGCSKVDLHARPELYIDPERSSYNVGDRVYFKCKGRLRLIGITGTRCSADGTWTGRNRPLTESDLPSCH